jgi:DNA polymerase-3 subunit delta
VRTLCGCAQQIEQGNGMDRVLQNHRVWDRRKALTKAVLTRMRGKQLQVLLRQANQIDQSIKGIQRNNSWLLMEQLVLSLSGKPLNI